MSILDADRERWRLSDRFIFFDCGKKNVRGRYFKLLILSGKICFFVAKREWF
jgi:hypothetical protein